MNFFKGLFGPGKDEVWNQLAEEMGGSFIQGGLLKPSMVQVGFKVWTITMDTYTVSHGKTSSTYTRIRAPFKNNVNFRFKVYNKGVFSDVGKMLGMQDIEIGLPQLDKNYIFKGNDEEAVKNLFSNQDLRALIMQQPKIMIEVKDNDGFFSRVPEGVDILYFHEDGVVKDIEKLKKLFLVFGTTLASLNGMGIAALEDPEVDYSR